MLESNCDLQSQLADVLKKDGIHLQAPPKESNQKRINWLSQDVAKLEVRPMANLS